MAKEGKKNKKDKAKKGNNNSGGEPQIARRLDGSIALTKLKCAILKKKNKKGKEVRGVFLPIDSNFLYEKDGAVYLNVRINLKDVEDSFKQHGFISQSVASELWKNASDKEKEKMKSTPILGGLKDFEFSSNSSSNDTAGNAGEIDEDDDLPF